jgi:hypothetical protein
MSDEKDVEEECESRARRYLSRHGNRRLAEFCRTNPVVANTAAVVTGLADGAFGAASESLRGRSGEIKLRSVVCICFVTGTDGF